MINNRISHIKDKELADYLSNHDLNLVAIVNGTVLHQGAEIIIIFTPTSYDVEKNSFFTRMFKRG